MCITVHHNCNFAIKMTIERFITFAFGLLLILCHFEEIAGYGEYYVRVKDKSQGRSFAGALISAHIIATAAVNVVNTSRYNPKSLVVYAGVTSNNQKAALQFRRATDVYVSYPESYSASKREFDYAGILVDPPFAINAFVQVIAPHCSYNRPLTGDITSVVVDDINPHRDEEKVTLKVLSDSKCGRYYHGTGKTTKCARELNGCGNAFKKTDIGAPVVQNNILIGLVIAVPYENDPKYHDRPILLTSFQKICRILSGPGGIPSRSYAENILFLRIKSQESEKYLRPLISQTVSAA